LIFEFLPRLPDSSVRDLLIERERVMNLQVSITEFQDTLARLYLELEHRFKENQLIRDLWSAMAHDVTQQKRSLSVIPPSFWHKLKKEHDGWSKAISESTQQQAAEKKEDQSLKACFERALLFEEPATLKIYVPIIRKLRENWTDQALDFYIMVKSHLARIARVTQSFAGDPIIVLRSNVLLQHFEKGVQAPHVEAERPARRTHGAHPAQEKHAAKPKKLAQKASAVAKHAQSHHSRTKPLVEKINLPRRRRAHR